MGDKGGAIIFNGRVVAKVSETKIALVDPDGGTWLNLKPDTGSGPCWDDRKPTSEGPGEGD
jgi:hypothetical protein